MEPTFMLIRGKSPALKAAAISALGEGQRALCMFRIMYDHSYKSAAEYYAWISYLLDQPGYWSGVLEGVRFFADTAMLELLEQTRERLAARNVSLGVGWGDAGLMDIGADEKLLEMVTGLYVHFQQIAPHSLSLIADYIRAHPEEFVEISG
ncbi:hypothetical protein [Paenibacillus sp. HW567]|uniref:hypothetical protein n=1 Tax=Paenibacillus sp. HW567 TaxID=1034769 RepID=UPI0003A34BBB|nr:hypothetical protein [Paenibacillus sp. HW567]